LTTIRNEKISSIANGCVSSFLNIHSQAFNQKNDVQDKDGKEESGEDSDDKTEDTINKLKFKIVSSRTDFAASQAENSILLMDLKKSNEKCQGLSARIEELEEEAKKRKHN
jgi:hypothetical protein